MRRLRTLMVAVVVTAGSLVAPATVAQAAATSPISTTGASTATPFCNGTGVLQVSTGWIVIAPSLLARTGRTYQRCYLRYGDRADSVEALQEALQSCYGFSLRQEWGYYGVNTRAAVMQVQRLHGITVDGLYGPQTFKAMRWLLWKPRSDTHSERCYRPFVNRVLALAPSPGSYSPYCERWEFRYASNGWWVSLPGTRTRTGQVSFACYLKPGDHLYGVQILQRELQDCYRSKLVEDGYYGPQTKAVIERVQTLHGIHVDGIYGPATMKAMYWRLEQRSAPHMTSALCHSPF